MKFEVLLLIATTILIARFEHLIFLTEELFGRVKESWADNMNRWENEPFTFMVML